MDAKAILNAFAGPLKDIRGRAAESEALSEAQVEALLHRILRKVEGEGVEVNWSNLSLLYADSARATLMALLGTRFELELTVLNGTATENHPACLAGGIAIDAERRRIKPLCSCALVSSSLTATAGHCMRRKDCITHVSPKSAPGGRQDWYEIEPKWLARPEQTHGSVRRDLALLKIVGKSFPQDIPLPRYARPELFGRATRALLVAYGPSYPFGSDRGVRNEGCVSPIWKEEIRDKDGRWVDFDPKTEFVCGAGLTCSSGPQDALVHDSGGSLYLWDEDLATWTLAGILSRGAGLNGDFTEGVGGVYTKLCAFKQDLEKFAGNICSES